MIMKRRLFPGLMAGIAVLGAIVSLRAAAGREKEKIVFVRLIDGYWQVCVASPEGGRVSRVTRDEGDKRCPAWTPDGRNIIYRTNNNLVFQIDRSGKSPKRILPEMGSIADVSFSPDGAGVLFVRFREDLLDRSDVMLVDAGAQSRRCLTRETALYYNPVFSPDGKKIAYVAGSGFGTHEIFVMDAGGENQARLTENHALDMQPAWSPDGKMIAYVSDAGGNYDIWKMDADGNNKIRLTGYEGIDSSPSWSPDGKKIVFASSRSGEMQLWVMEVDGSDPRQITRGSPSMDPKWFDVR